MVKILLKSLFFIGWKPFRNISCNTPFNITLIKPTQDLRDGWGIRHNPQMPP